MKRILLCLLLIALATAHTAHAGLVFEPYHAIPTGSWPEAVVIADLNNDGRNDVVMTTSFYFDAEHDFKVFVFFQDSSGNLQSPVIYSGGTGKSVALGDVNGDGRIDIVTTTDTGIGVLHQEEDGTFLPMQTIMGPQSVNVKIGDMNNDGRLDVVSIGWGSNSVEVYMQKNDGTFDAPLSYSVLHDGFDDLALGDLNDDGLLDIAVMSGQGLSPNVGILYQLQNGTYSSPDYLDLGGNELAGGIAVGDINGDGLNDVVITNWVNTSRIGVFRQKVDGGFMPPEIHLSFDEPEPVVIADLNNDSRADIVALHGGGTAGIFLQKSDGSLDAYQAVSSPYATHFNRDGLAVGDINGDGYPDIVIANYNYGLVIARQSCVPTFSVSFSTFNQAGGNGSVALLCSWTATSNSPWITITSGNSGVGAGSVQFSVEPNMTGAVRKGTLTIAGQTYNVIQGTPAHVEKIGIYANGNWYLDGTADGVWNGAALDLTAFFGFAGAHPVRGDWDGNGIPRIGVYANGYWYLDMNADGVWNGPDVDSIVHFGFPGAAPVTGKWTNSGPTRIGVYSDGHWYLDVNGNGVWDGEPTDKVCHFGFNGALPVTGHWSGAGSDHIGVYANGHWYLDMDGDCAWNGANDAHRHFGFAGALPVTGDWNDTGTSKIGVYADGYWYLDVNDNGAWDGGGTDASYHFGFSGAVPLSGSW